MSRDVIRNTNAVLSRKVDGDYYAKSDNRTLEQLYERLEFLLFLFAIFSSRFTTITYHAFVNISASPLWFSLSLFCFVFPPACFTSPINVHFASVCHLFAISWQVMQSVLYEINAANQAQRTNTHGTRRPNPHPVVCKRFQYCDVNN